MQANDLTYARLRRLAATRPPNGLKVLSVYMDLDPASFGTQPARAAQIGSLIDAAERQERHAELAHAARQALRSDIEAARAFFHGDFSAKGAHGLALFVSQAIGLFEVLRLPVPVRSAVVVDDAPWLDPLIGHRRLRRGIALVSRRKTRVLLDTPDGAIAEVAAIADHVPNQHDQGGWSQANYERSIEEEVRKHLERSADLLFALWQREPYDLLAIGATGELYPELERQLHAYVRACCLGRFDVDVEHANAEQALAAAQPLFAVEAERRLRDLLGRLNAALAQGERAAAGLPAVLAAINERRVDVLLYEAGLTAPGYVCPDSGWLSVEPTSCPYGDGRAERREQILEDAIAAALGQSADVVALHDRPELGPHGGIAALLRF